MAASIRPLRFEDLPIGAAFKSVGEDTEWIKINDQRASVVGQEYSEEFNDLDPVQLLAD